MQNHVTWIYVSTFASLLIYTNIHTITTLCISIYTHSHPLRINDFSYFVNFVSNFCWWVWLSTRSPTYPEKKLGLQKNRLVGCHGVTITIANLSMPRYESQVQGHGVDGVGSMVTAWSFLDPRKAKSLFYIWLHGSTCNLYSLLPIHAHLQLGLFQ